MTLWDTLTGKPSSKSSTSTSSSSSSSTAQSSSEPSTSYSFDPTTAQDITSFLGSGESSFNPASLHPLAGLDQGTLEYLTLEDAALSDLPNGRSVLPSRGWSDDLTYGTGVTYVTALSVGGGLGLVEGLRRTPAAMPAKLKFNAVLNAVTRRGPFFGNSAGVVAMLYNGLNSTIGYYRGKHDPANSIIAGTMSGMLFKSTRGLRPMLTSGALVGTIAAVWAFFTHKAL